MEDLKENTQKKIMEKLVLSAALGMYCYWSNNASEPPKPETPKEEIKVSNDNATNKKSVNKEAEKTIKKKQDEECCPCCCCHYKKKEKEDGQKQKHLSIEEPNMFDIDF